MSIFTECITEAEKVGLEIGQQAIDLSRSYVELLKVEIQEKKNRAIRGLILLILAVIISSLGILICSLAFAQKLAETYPNISQSFGLFIIGTAWILISAALFIGGYRQIRLLAIKPQATINSIKESCNYIWKTAQKNN